MIPEEYEYEPPYVCTACGHAPGLGNVLASVGSGFDRQHLCDRCLTELRRAEWAAEEDASEDMELAARAAGAIST